MCSRAVDEGRGILVDVINIFLTPYFEVVLGVPVVLLLGPFCGAEALENGADD